MLAKLPALLALVMSLGCTSESTKAPVEFWPDVAMKSLPDVTAPAMQVAPAPTAAPSEPEDRIHVATGVTIYRESEGGEPVRIGCADGQREGFADIHRHPRIAGCRADWDNAKSLRDKPTGKPCGDDQGLCAVPADACAPGWHICGTTGKREELREKLTVEACDHEAGPGKFVAAMSHSQSKDLCPPVPTRNTVFPCMDSGIGSEPVCCGDNCSTPMCRNALWEGQTRISVGFGESCGAVTSERNGGIMCCQGKWSTRTSSAPTAH